ncbi:MAG: class I SAM-dependent methyltransferase [Streptosporangiaceae bacterium]
MTGVFAWDETLYAGSAAYYAQGRLPYPRELAAALRDALGLDGTGRLLDVGCGPGSLTLPLAPLFAAVTGIDPDRGMIEQAAATAIATGVPSISWYPMCAEDLPGKLGRFRVVTFGQSFHWVDQPRVAAAVRRMLLPAGGACVIVDGTTHEGAAGPADGPPRPPREQIRALVGGYLGPQRRAGLGFFAADPDDRDGVLRAAGLRGPARITVSTGTVHARTEDQVVASVFSLSSAAPHLFGDRLGEFERDLRDLLRLTSPDGRFSERLGDISADIWRP